MPCLAHALRVFDRTGVLQHTGGRSAVRKELRSKLFGCDGKSDCVLGHGNRAVAYETVEAQAGDMEDVRRLENDRFALAANLFDGSLVLEIQLAIGIPIDCHLVWHERVQSDHFTFAVANHLRVGVAPQQQVCHEGFAEDKTTHFRVRLIVEEHVKRMAERFLFAACICVPVKMNWQTGDRLREDSHAGIDSRHLHCRSLRYGFASRGAAHEEGIAAACRPVLGLIS